MKHLVINLGMSRTGSTFLERMLARGKGYFSFKLHENRRAHTLQGADGLVEFVRSFRRRQVVLVHSRRDPEEVWQSILGAQRARAGFMAQWNDHDRCLERQAAELAAWEEFVSRLDEVRKTGLRVQVVTVHYEQLDELADRERFLQQLAAVLPRRMENLRIWRGFFEEWWMQKAVGVGRLHTRLSRR